MIEQAMIFALGFMIASLLGLLFLPVLSRRATRLAKRRLEMLVPWSVGEIAAERDQIRAGHAAATRRLEQTIEALTAGKAEAMSQAGRAATDLIALRGEQALALRRIEALQADLGRATTDARDAQATLGLQMQLLHDSLGAAERRLAILRDTEARLGSAAALNQDQAAVIDALEQRATAQDVRIRKVLGKAARAESDLMQVRKSIDALADQRDMARADFALMAAKRDGLEAERDIAREQLAVAESRHAEAAAAMMERIAAQAADIAALQARFAEAAVTSAAPIARLNGAAAREAGAALPDVDPGEVARMRQAIAALADDLLRFARPKADTLEQPAAVAADAPLEDGEPSPPAVMDGDPPPGDDQRRASVIS